MISLSRSTLPYNQPIIIFFSIKLSLVNRTEKNRKEGGGGGGGNEVDRKRTSSIMAGILNLLMDMASDVRLYTASASPLLHAFSQILQSGTLYTVETQKYFLENGFPVAPAR
uniref:Uncharacterized protein n=1 Tax=Caenorhabditis japonica TaxID=281687 RepID=A0A8R1IYF3_CAEJA